MVKHTQTIRRLLPTICLSVSDHFVGLAPKGLTCTNAYSQRVHSESKSRSRILLNVVFYQNFNGLCGKNPFLKLKLEIECMISFENSYFSCLC